MGHARARKMAGKGKKRGVARGMDGEGAVNGRSEGLCTEKSPAEDDVRREGAGRCTGARAQCCSKPTVEGMGTTTHHTATDGW